MDPIDKEAAAVALQQATARLEALTRLLTPRARRESAARRMLAILEVVRPLVAAVGHLIAAR